MSGTIESILGTSLSEELVTVALTHRSFAFEHGGIAHNERLEFLGDAILGAAVTERLIREFPDEDEGQLAKRRAALVSTLALARVARLHDVGVHVRLGLGEATSGGADKSSILADVMEALIGAVFLEHGFAAATDMVHRLLEPLWVDPNVFDEAHDPKTSLQELAAARRLPPPEYKITEDGPDHQKVFTAVVTVGSTSASGSGSSKKAAEIAAALSAWNTLRS